MSEDVVTEELERSARPWPRQVTVPVVVVAVLLVAVLAVVDERIRVREDAALDRCSVRIEEDVRDAGRKLWAVVGYTRPTLFTARPGPLRDSLNDMIAEAAVGAADTLVPVLRDCSQVSVLWAHGELRDRRTACVRLVQTFQEYYETVARDGSRVLEDARRFRAC